MATNCPDCKGGILNKQHSALGTPQCNGNCPEDVTCDGNTVNSSCVIVNVNMDCVEVEAGQTLSEALSALNEKCQQTIDSGNSCKVKINSDDTCCGYLEDKITSTTLDIEVSTEGRTCKHLTIEEKDWTWVDINNLKSPWKNLKNVQSSAAKLQYGYKNNEVRFKGQVYTEVASGSSQLLSAALPTTVRPSERKVFTTTYSDGTSVLIINIVIQTTGVVNIEILFPVLPSTTSNVIFSLDFINYIK